MMAFLAFLRIVPAWAYGALLIVAAGVGIEYHGRAHTLREWRAHDAEIARIAGMAQAAATARNDQIALQQQADNKRIVKGYTDEIAKIRADIARAPRLRVGPGLCAGFASATETGSASRSDGADSASRPLPPALDRDIKALIEETELVATTGRACQDFIRSNGMGP